MAFRDDHDLLSDFCPKCGQYAGGDSICPNCGAKIFDDSGLQEEEEESEENEGGRHRDDEQDDDM